MKEMIPVSALADLSDAELWRLGDHWTHWRDGWGTARQYGLLVYCCEGEMVEVLLSAGVAEAERHLNALRQEAERRPSMQDEMRERWA